MNKDNLLIINSQRAVYERALAVTGGNPDFIIQEKTLRLESVLVPGRNTYSFDLLENNSSDRPGEEKLNRNDLFLVSAIALNLTKQISATDNRTGNNDLYSFPDGQFFVGAPGSGEKEYRCLNTIYNGRTSIKTSPVERVRDFLNRHFLYIPEKGTLKQASPAINDEAPQYGPYNEGRGFYPIIPNVVIDGNENNSIELTLASGDTAVIDGSLNAAGTAATTRNIVVFLVNGFVIVNGAKAALKYGF
jgi:hypothetical protein